MGIGDRYDGFLRRVDAAPRRAAILATLLMLPAMYLCARYFAEVHAGMQDLLPRDAPVVRAAHPRDVRAGRPVRCDAAPFAAGAFPADEARDEERAALNFERGLNPMGVARQLLAIFASGDRRKKLNGVKVPALVIHGDADPLVRLAAGEDTARNIPGAKLVVVKTMGHAIPSTVSAQVVEAIAQHAGAHPA